MGAQRPNIQKHIDSQPKHNATNGKQTSQPKSIVEAMLPMAQKYVESMDAKYKWAIVGLLYVILTGVGINLYLIYQLITTQIF